MVVYMKDYNVKYTHYSLECKISLITDESNHNKTGTFIKGAICTIFVIKYSKNTLTV